MIELVFTVCLATSADTCQEKRLTYAENISPRVCMMMAQPELAKWSVGNPKWQIKRWHCKTVDFATVDL